MNTNNNYKSYYKSCCLMSEFGAESILIEQTAQRLGRALGVDSVEISMIPVAIVLTTLNHHQSVTTTRRVHHKPINMSIVCEIQKIIDMKKKSYDVTYLLAKLKQIQPNYYNRWLVVFDGRTCLCLILHFLQGSDWVAFFYYLFSIFYSYVCTTRTCKKEDLL